jgi:3-oxosteroid 1-dehydrogenase
LFDETQRGETGHAKVGTVDRLIIAGAGLGGLAAAVTAAELGLEVIVLEKDDRVGGAAAYSGGQVWVGSNHVAERLGFADSVDETLAYVRAAARRDPRTLDDEMARQWIVAARDAARWFEDRGVVGWETIPGYADYYYPDLDGSRADGRYLTGTPFDGRRLAADRKRLHVTPTFPTGLTYAEMFAWGGMASRTGWDEEVMAERRRTDTLTFGTGLVAAFFAAALDRGVPVRTGCPVVKLLVDGDRAVIGVRCRTPQGEEDLHGRVVLATGSHDWSPELTERFTGIPPADGGSVAPRGVTGDAIGLVEACDGAVAALPAWAAPAIPGYRIEPAHPGDSGYRACYEQSRPHTFLVNRAGQRFCDDSFHSSIVATALTRSAGGTYEHFPFFMIWDEQHRRKYGLGATAPGGDYPPGLVTSAPTLGELALRLGIEADGLERTAAAFNEGARTGEDPVFGRGSNLAVRSWRGDENQHPNPCVGAVADAPFHGMRMRLVNTGIAAAGVRTGPFGQVVREDDSLVPGLYAIGEAATRTTGGVGYNSGYSLSRTMAYGWLAAHHVAGRTTATVV